MEKVDLLVSAPHFFTMEGDGLGHRSNSTMAVDRGKILALGPRPEILNLYRGHRTIDVENHAVLPGFIDAHMHITLCGLRGLAQDTGYWMMYGLAPFSHQMDEATGILGAQLAVAEAVRAGTTTFGEFGRRPDLLIPLFEKVGVRAQITVTIREALDRIYNPGELYEFDAARGERMLDTCLDIFARFNHAADGRITVLFGPQGPDFVSRDLLLRIQKLARDRQTKIHMHTQQGDRETAQMMMRYEKRPIAWLDEIGYLDETLIAVHLTDADENEAQLVARRGAAMTLCSGSIGIIDGVVPPARAFQEAGGMVALGSDQAPGNNNHNMINEMKLTALFNKIRYQDPEVMPAWRVLRMATIEGARALGLDASVGSLAAGKQADFILVDLTRPSLAPVYTEPMRNIVPNLVYSGRGDEVSLAAVDGRVIYEDGQLVHLDESAVVSAVQEAADRLGPRAADEFWKVNGTNARFMKEGKL
ncbi:S-adenosylhomocysteine deaminase (EC; Methylthioadenosine deaminase (EC [Olavius sp. associated proteobacterium Delta 1]|nr:S-adenosylhomocysteine deaminase (EC; Methylthioadenosine deaminase (EC [Olavius sp. associated proteobacterium Delta 1]